VRENIGAKGMDGDGLIRGRLRRCCGEGGIESDRYVDSLGGGGSWGRFYFREICGCRDGCGIFGRDPGSRQMEIFQMSPWILSCDVASTASPSLDNI
jgi:hypothetical protein